MAAVASRNAGPVFGGLMSAFTRRPTSSLDNSGVLSARRLNGPAPSALQNQATTGAFGVSEARSRLRDFDGGRYVPSLIKELASDRKSVVEGKSVSVTSVLVGRPSNKTKDIPETLTK